MLNILRKHFDISGRMGRKQFWIAQLIIFILLIGFIFIDYYIGQNYMDDIFGQWKNLFTLYTASLLVSISLFCGIKRMHDINKSGWFFLIPIVNLILSVLKSFEGDNKYGTFPKNRTDEIKKGNEVVFNGYIFINKNISTVKLLIAFLLGTICIFINNSYLANIIYYLGNKSIVDLFVSLMQIPFVIILFSIGSSLILSILFGYIIAFIAEIIVCVVIFCIFKYANILPYENYNFLNGILISTFISVLISFIVIITLKIYNKIKKTNYTGQVILLLFLFFIINIFSKVNEIYPYLKLSDTPIYINFFYCAKTLEVFTNSFYIVHLLYLWRYIFKTKNNISPTE